MKIKILTLVALFGMLISCKEDDPEPTAAEKQGILLAGKKGESKTWLLTDYEVDGNTIDDIVCLEGNEYTFFNNAAQSFEGDEGDQRCTDSGTGQPLSQEIESGNWAFTIDGEIVIIASSDVKSPIAIFSTFTALGNPFPAEVISLTSTQLIIEVEYSTPSFTESVRMSFEAAN